MLLTVAEVHLLLEIIGRETVHVATDAFPFHVTTRYARGYSSNAEIAALQAKLSVMGEVAAARERR